MRRTPIAQPAPAGGFELTADRRYPFVGQDLGGHGWNSNGIGSVVGGLTIVGKDREHESLRMFYTSGSSNGVAILRRDGFASIGSSIPGQSTVSRKIVYFIRESIDLCSSLKLIFNGYRF